MVHFYPWFIFLFSFVSIRIAKSSLAEKAVLVTQSSMCLHDNIKQIMLKFHTTELCACSHTRGGGGGANEALVHQTTEEYFLLSDPFI